MGWQWQQLDHMQIIFTLLQTDNHVSTSPLCFFYRPDVLLATQPTMSKHLRQRSRTSGQSNLTKRPHHHRTWMVQSYSRRGDNAQTHLIRASLEPPPSSQQYNPNGISIGSAVFAGLMIVTDRQIYRQCYSIYNMYICSTVTWPNDIISSPSSALF